MGRHKDVLTLLDKAPWWGKTNVSQLLDRSVSEHNLGLVVARAMHENKKTEDALKIIDVVIAKNAGLDPAYELLIKLDPDGAMKKLDVLIERDPYQERPLIWKAKMLLEESKLDEAEQTIKHAISIDPSDGEQGKNTRMFAYKILADVLRRGDYDAAKVYDGAIAAIRLAERADDYKRASLYSIARKMYLDSLAVFNDAYCIQSRLAIQLYDEGDLDGAAVHFERAYQLMPNSFGLIESHCFGCEKVHSAAT